MIRYIYCMECSGSMKLHPADADDGLRMRAVTIEKCRVPENHQIEIFAGDSHHHVIPVPILVCDRCNAEIPTSTPCEAVTIWDGNREEFPGDWEREFSAP